MGHDTYDKTVKTWDDVAQTEKRSAAIHPAGNLDWEAYERSGFENALEVMRVARACSMQLDATTLLDYGCGDGRVARHLIGRAFDVIGYDTSQAMRTAYRNVTGRETIAHVAGLHQYVDASGDAVLVYSFAVWIHHTYADGRRMLVELGRQAWPRPWMKPGVILALQIPIYDVAREPENWTDVGVWTPKQLADAAEEAGFVVQTIHTNLGAFDYAAPGPNHARLQVLRKAG